MSTREIKFRCWNTLQDVMQYPLGVSLNELKSIEEEYPEWYPESIIWMQYTGLLDKHGKEIYEGDILSIGIKDANGKVWMNREAVIIWHEYGFCLEYTKSRIERDKEVGICDINENRKEFEVIGNIYQTPDLIK